MNHSVNDILVMGARPLFFLDYFASATICQDHLKFLMEGMSQACLESKTVILGGETAEMPGIYQTNEVDIVGTIIGIVDEENVIDGKKNIKEGDIVLAIPSSGPHTNGYSLIRKICQDFPPPQEILDQLYQPHRSYLPIFQKISQHQPEAPEIHGLCHVTGGGLIDNPVRVLADGLQMEINKKSFTIPTVFRYFQQVAHLPDEELYRVFNCGLGMLIITSAEDAKVIQEIIQEIDEECFVVGSIGRVGNSEEPKVKIV